MLNDTMIHKMRFILLLGIMIIANSSYAQVHYVFLDDTNSYIQIELNRPIFYGEFNIELRDSLDDGLWIIYNKYRKDSATIDSHNIICTGQFKNQKKNGVFSKYYIFEENSNPRLFQRMIYVDDTLHGLCLEKSKLSYYFKGRKNGTEIEYYSPFQFDDIKLIRNFNNDTLYSWQYFDENGVLRIYSIYDYISNVGIYYYYRLGEIASICYYDKSNLLRKVEYENGIIIKEVFQFSQEYKMRPKTILLMEYEDLFNITVPFNGYIIYYSNFGKDKKKVVYVNGKKL